MAAKRGKIYGCHSPSAGQKSPVTSSAKASNRNMTDIVKFVRRNTALSFMIAAAIVLKVVENSKIFTFVFITNLKKRESLHWRWEKKIG